MIHYVLGGDPHYMLRVRGVDHPVCFDLPTKENKIYNAVTDPVNREYIFAVQESTFMTFRA